MERPEVLASYYVGLGQYASTEWDMRPRWWQWGFGFGKERIHKNGRGCYDGGYPYWGFGISLEWGRYSLRLPFGLSFTRWSEEGDCTYDFHFPPYDWEIEYPWSPYYHRRPLALKPGTDKGIHWWQWKARGITIGLRK